jgi:hypothetical protein
MNFPFSFRVLQNITFGSRNIHRRFVKEKPTIVKNNSPKHHKHVIATIKFQWHGWLESISNKVDT